MSFKNILAITIITAHICHGSYRSPTPLLHGQHFKRNFEVPPLSNSQPKLNVPSIPITQTKLWGVLMLLKKALPLFGLPINTIRQIALDVVCTTTDEYTEYERHTIAYEFISDSIHDSYRLEWLFKFFTFNPGNKAVLEHVSCDKFVISFDSSLSRMYVHYNAIKDCIAALDRNTYTQLHLLVAENKDFSKIEQYINQAGTQSRLLLQSVLLIALLYDKVAVLQEIRKTIPLTRYQDRYGKNLLHYVSNPGMALFLINEGVNINKEDTKGITPLMSALHGGKFYNNDQQQKTIALLLMHGANLFTSAGQSLKKYAARIECDKTIIALLK
jgi:hypothetical protein